MTANAPHGIDPAGNAIAVVADDLTGAADAAIHIYPGSRRDAAAGHGKAGAFGREEDLVQLYRMLKGVADPYG